MGLFSRRAEPNVIDLRDHAGRKGLVFQFGFPTRCPQCDGRGYLDHIDPHRNVQTEHCTECGFRWQTTEAEVVALNG